VLAGAARELNIAKSANDAARTAAAARSLLAMGNVLGLLQQPPDVYLKRASVSAPGRGEGDTTLSDAEIETLMLQRRAARAAKDFRESDRIRDRLSAAGIVLEDKPGGISEWSRS
jgi:cysteinyl-tRNA synthetase